MTLAELVEPLSLDDCRQVGRWWWVWAREEQLPPEGDWTTWLLLGGRGSGKTRAGAEWVRGGAEGLVLGDGDPERFRGPQFAAAWFTELGCAAVDKGANQPNLFPDPKSAEDGRPYFSNGAPDALLQRQVLRAHLRHWSGAGNPVSTVYAGPMVGRISLWSWDARPYPAFPGDAESWADAPNHAAGHWLTGRLGALASDELAAAIAADHDIEIVGTAAAPLVHGLALERPGSAREALDGLCAVTGLAVRDGAAGLELVRPVARQAVGFDEPVDDGGALISRRRPDPSERVARLALGYADRERDYLMASATAIRPEAGQLANQASGLVLDPAGGRQAAERLLAASGAQRDALDLTLPPSLAALEVGDVIALAGAADGPFEITEIRDGAARRIAARALPPLLNPAVLSGRPPALPGGGGIGLPVAEPLLVAAHLPPDPATPLVSRLLLAAFADPWPGQVELQLVATGERLTRLDRPAALGELASPLAAGPIERWDGAELVVTLFGGHLASVDGMAVLAGSNRIAVATDAGEFEVLGFAGAELIAPRTYRLSGLLRGQGGTDPAMGPAAAGNRVVVLDAGVALVDVPPGWAGDTLALRAFAGRHDGVGWPLDVPVGLGPLLPLPPAHPRARRNSGGDVNFGWIRRSRADGGAWAAAEVGLEHLPEAYRLTVLAGGLPVRTLEAGAPAATYTAAEQAADFGSLPASFDFTVAQLSPVYGPGHPASGSFHA
ncbi:MAG: glycoside hydrolase TIM-barrel-like domain-containing protein [Devosia sp.]|nr:glycoside hydrolase TIM-barrel-like domain-containing protein [Devosia sp.]